MFSEFHNYIFDNIKSFDAGANWSFTAFLLPLQLYDGSASDVYVIISDRISDNLSDIIPSILSCHLSCTIE